MSKMHNKYLKYKKKYLDLKSQMTGGVPLTYDDLANIRGDVKHIPQEVLYDLVFDSLPDYKKIEWVEKRPNIDRGGRALYLREPVELRDAFIVRNPGNWRLVDKFMIEMFYDFVPSAQFFQMQQIHPYIKYIQFDNEFNAPLANSLNTLVNLETLVFGDEFNQPLGTSLNTLVNLKTLNFGRDFNQPLDNSLINLTQLETLGFYDIFGDPVFNRDLGDSLNSLVNLRKLNLGNGFNQPLNNSLDTLRNLRKLNLGAIFNQELNLQYFQIRLPRLQTIKKDEIVIWSRNN
jgi:hypothetical protein